MSILDHTLAPRVALLKPTAVNTILADVRRVQATGASVVSLMRGEPDFRTPDHIGDAVIAALRAGRTSYPDNRGEIRFREAVAAKLARDNGVSYDPGTEILVTTGATLGLACALTAVVGDGDEVLLPDPIYDAYHSPIALAGGRSRAVRASIVEDRFELPVDALEAAVTPATRVLLLNTPWNPVGTVFRRDELEALAAFVLRRNLLLISDEIYETIVFDGHRHVCPASLSPELRARTIVVNSLSKTYAMPGWRVGYCAAPAAIIQAMFLVLQQSSRGPATFIQDAAAVALTGTAGADAGDAAGICRPPRAGDHGAPGHSQRARAPARRRLLRDGGRARHRADVERRAAASARAARRGGGAWIRVRPGRRRHAPRVVRERRRQPGARARAAARGALQPVTLLKVDALPPLAQADPARVDAGALERALREHTTAEVRFDGVSRALYSTDASVYKIASAGRRAAADARGPRADRPHLRRRGLSAHDAGRRHVAGGQAIGDGLVVDTSKYLNRCSR